MGCIANIVGAFLLVFLGFQSSVGISSAPREPMGEVSVISSSDTVATSLDDVSDWTTVTVRLEDGGFVVGNPNAAVTIVGFEDFMCPHCQRYEPTVDQFVADYVMTGQARFEYRFFPIVDPTFSPLTANLVECASGEDYSNFWKAHEVMYGITTAERFNDSTINKFAQQMDLNLLDLVDCTESAEQVTIDQALARAMGATGTPTIMYRLNGGEIINTPFGTQPTNEELAQIVEDAKE